MIPLEATVAALALIGVVGFFLTRWNARRLDERVKQAKEEMAKNPRDPYQALAELFAEQEPRRKSRRGDSETKR